MSKENKITVGVSIGDSNGIGPEVVLKAFEDSRMLDFCTPIIYGSVKMMSQIKKECDLTLNFQGIDHISRVVHGKVNVINVWKEQVEITYGIENNTSGSYAYKSLVAATEDLKNDRIDVLVTAPINKHNIQSDNFNFPGHTEYLSSQLDGDGLMLMVSENLRIGLLTGHIPVKEVSSKINEELIRQKINLMHASLIRDFGISVPKIAVLGINPHTGDQGVIGEEDDKIMRPAIEKIFIEGKKIYGPYSADSFFGSANFKNFDAIMACYHDQGLIPFKTLAFGKGVNYTAGLTKIRTSPDHGTGIDIAGKNKADCGSFKEAVFLAITIFKKRKEYIELTQNKLKISDKRAISKKE